MLSCELGLWICTANPLNSRKVLRLRVKVAFDQRRCGYHIFVRGGAESTATSALLLIMMIMPRIPPPSPFRSAISQCPIFTAKAQTMNVTTGSYRNRRFFIRKTKTIHLVLVEAAAPSTSFFFAFGFSRVIQAISNLVCSISLSLAFNSRQASNLFSVTIRFTWIAFVNCPSKSTIEFLALLNSASKLPPISFSLLSWIWSFNCSRFFRSFCSRSAQSRSCLPMMFCSVLKIWILFSSRCLFRMLPWTFLIVFCVANLYLSSSSTRTFAFRSADCWRASSSRLIKDCFVLLSSNFRTSLRHSSIVRLREPVLQTETSVALLLAIFAFKLRYGHTVNWNTQSRDVIEGDVTDARRHVIEGATRQSQ